MKKRSVKEGRCVGSGRSAGRRKADKSSAEKKRGTVSRRKRTNRQQGKAGGPSDGEKRADRQTEKSGRSVGRRKASGTSAGEKRADRHRRKAGGASAGEKRAERRPKKRRSIAPNTPRREQAAKAKKAAGKILRLFCISGQRAERPAISRSARYSRRRPASLAVWWRRPFHGRPPSAARPFRRRRSP